VTIRLLDPPLHEFLPHSDAEIAHVATAMGADPPSCASARRSFRIQPDAGFRGVRLGVAFPEIVDMQARAIFEAAIAAAAETGEPRKSKSWSAGVLESRAGPDQAARRRDRASHRGGDGPALQLSHRRDDRTARATLRAGDIALTAEFLSFGTNDLTQTTLGISRDDAGAFLGAYVAKGVLPADPFVTIDQEGVGELVAIGCERARKARPNVALGVCGEHGGDPASIDFFEEVGVDYVSCSPFRVPIARLAAARPRCGARADRREPLGSTARRPAALLGASGTPREKIP